jgi:hypothetical protein
MTEDTPIEPMTERDQADIDAMNAPDVVDEAEDALRTSLAAIVDPDEIELVAGYGCQIVPMTFEHEGQTHHALSIHAIFQSAKQVGDEETQRRFVFGLEDFQAFIQAGVHALAAAQLSAEEEGA